MLPQQQQKHQQHQEKQQLHKELLQHAFLLKQKIYQKTHTITIHIDCNKVT